MQCHTIPCYEKNNWQKTLDLCNNMIVRHMYIVISLFITLLGKLQHSEYVYFSPSLPFSLCLGWGAARNFFNASSDRLFHPPLYIVFFFQSSSSPAFLDSLLTQSTLLSLDLPRLLLPCSRNSAALFGGLSSAILSTCPLHCNLLPTSLSVKLLCTPPFFSCLPSFATLAIFRTQLFSLTCILCCCSSVNAKVSAPYRHAGVTQVLMTLLFSLFEIRRSAITPSTALHAFAPACTLRRTSLSVFQSPRTAPPRYTTLSPSSSMSSSSLWWPTGSTSVFSRLMFCVW